MLKHTITVRNGDQQPEELMYSVQQQLLFQIQQNMQLLSHETVNDSCLITKKILNKKIKKINQ